MFEQVVNLHCNYIHIQSLWLDAKIVAKTVTKVLLGDAWCGAVACPALSYRNPGSSKHA
ncbi:MAG: hypothetical protein IVW54_19860 [Candidatus Binataceae bacterium]|nr:hypothetical protein [Candidatus Binataceae bacterium]